MDVMCTSLEFCLAPNDYGHWADVCGARFLFGNKIVRNHQSYESEFYKNDIIARSRGSKTFRNAADWA
jgi:hypothetical protein